MLVDPPSTRTTLAGVFACGDAVDRTCWQAVTAAGTGAAAINAGHWLAAREPVRHRQPGADEYRWS